MKKVLITEKMLNRAKERDKGVLNSGSFMKGEGNLPGNLGEELVQKEFDLKFIGDYGFDFLWNDRKIEVKTKKQNVGFDPKGDYEGSVAIQSLHQDPDIYIFCRVYKRGEGDYPYGWICGWITKKDLLEKAERKKIGDHDSSNDYMVRNACINIRYDQLNTDFNVLQNTISAHSFRD